MLCSPARSCLYYDICYRMHDDHDSRESRTGAEPPACSDTEILTGTWDSREVGYASNHDVREEGVWTDAYPVPATLTQKCRYVTGTCGGCDGKLTGRIEKNTFTGTYTERCTTDADTTTGTFL